MTIEASDDSLKAKKVPYPELCINTWYTNTDTTQGKEGVVAFKTTQAVIIAHHPDTIQTTNAFNSVAELGDYLKKHGM
jgi:profilin